MAHIAPSRRRSGMPRPGHQEVFEDGPVLHGWKLGGTGRAKHRPFRTFSGCVDPDHLEFGFAQRADEGFCAMSHTGKMTPGAVTFHPEPITSFYRPNGSPDRLTTLGDRAGARKRHEPWRRVISEIRAS